MQIAKKPLLASRPNLSEQIKAEVRRLVIAGDFVDGQRLNEVELASQLQVSRTPLREALSQLVAERFVEVIPRRGFFVAQLSPEEVDQLYVVRQLLDPAALRMSGIPDAKALARLEELNTAIASAEAPECIIELDDAFHIALIAGCGNEILLDLIRQHMRRTLRYELAYMSAGRNVTLVVQEHNRIVECLRAGDLDGACEALKDNMSSAPPALVDWLEHRSDEA